MKTTDYHNYDFHSRRLDDLIKNFRSFRGKAIEMAFWSDTEASVGQWGGAASIAWLIQSVENRKFLWSLDCLSAFWRITFFCIKTKESNSIDQFHTSNLPGYFGALHLQTPYCRLILSILRHAVACLSFFQHSKIPSFHYYNHHYFFATLMTL